MYQLFIILVFFIQIRHLPLRPLQLLLEDFVGEVDSGIHRLFLYLW